MTYAWPFLAGHPVLDLVDTVSWRLDPSRAADRLPSPDLLGAWATGAGIIENSQSTVIDAAVASDPVAARGVLADLHALRAVATDLLDGLALHQETRNEAALELVRVRYLRAVSGATPRISATDGRLTWSLPVEGTPRETLAAVGDRLAVALVELLSGPDLSRLRRCEGEGCGWLFLDLTRNHSRRWCAAGDCGNRARVRRHRAALKRLPEGRQADRVTKLPGASAGATYARGWY